MRILYLAAAAHVAGGNRFLLNLFSSTKEQGIESVVVVPEKGNMQQEAEAISVTVEVLPTIQPGLSSIINTYRCLKNWRKVLKKHKPDLIHANDFWVARSVMPAAKSLNIPVICHVHFKQNESFCQWVFKGLPKPSAFVFCSNATQRETGPLLSSSYPSVPQHVVYNSVDIDKFTPKQLKSIDNNHVFKIGMISNIIPRKRVLDFVAVAEKVIKENEHAAFYVIGAELEESGDYGAQVREAIVKKSLQEHVTLLGFQSNVAGFLNQWDIVMCCAEHEELPISLIEAAASGLPMVSTDVGGINEIIEDGKNGYLVQVGDIEQMSVKLLSIMNSTSEYPNMSSAARKVTEEKFHPQSTANALRSIYEGLL